MDRVLWVVCLVMGLVGCQSSGGGDEADVPTPTPEVSGSGPIAVADNRQLAVSYSLVDSSDESFQAELTLHNHTEAPIDGWKLMFALSADIAEMENGTAERQDDGQYLILPDSTSKTIPAKGSVSVSFASTGVNDLNSLAVIDPPVPSVTTSNNPDFALSYRVVNSWAGGFQGEIVLSNSSLSSIYDWQLNFALPVTITDIWGATVASQSGDSYQIAPLPWTTTVPVGSSITIGFNAAGEGELSQVTLVDPDYQVTVPESEVVVDGEVTPSPEPEVSSPDATTITLTTPPAYNGFGPATTPIFNYGEALQMAWYFYEAQRSGPLPKVDGDLPFFDPRTGELLHNGFKANRVPWRGDSGLDDGADVGVDLTGGWHDAGDHVKFGLPMAFSASYLAWGVLEFEEALRQTDQLVWAKDNLRWVADYLVRAHVSPNELYGQVGAGHVDHSIWGSPEVMPHFRPAWKIDLENSGPDLAAQTSAALTTISMVFRESEPTYADVLLQRAKELYAFAQATRDDSVEHLGRYSDSILDAKSFYSSRAGAKDDLPFAAAWLYVATKEPAYLHAAEADYLRISDREGHKGWTMVWDDVRYGVYMLMSKIYSDPDYAADSLITREQRRDGYYDYNLHAQNFINHWLSPGGVGRTPAGMAYLTSWGSARYTTSTALLALIYRKHLQEQGVGQTLQDSYLKFATEQMNYVLGDNPLNMSYVVGFGDNYSQYAHHRAAHGSTTNSIGNPSLPRHVLFGGLAGGPGANDGYTTSRSAFVMTEVATDMNAGMTGLLAGLVDAYGIAGNEPDPSFPPAGPEYREIYTKALLKTQQPADLATEVLVTVVNESAYPPRHSEGYLFRYFVNLKELFDQGYTLDDVVLETYWDEGAGVTLQRLEDSAYIFYIEGSFVGTNITPLGTDKKQKNIQFIVRLPWVDRGWDGSNDPSYQDLIANTAVVTDKIALYDTNLPEGEQLIWGVVPDVGIRQSELPPPGSEPDSTAPVAGTFTTSIDVYNLWETGHCAKFTVTNSGSVAAQPKLLQFMLAGSVNITNSWNGTITRDGDTVDVVLPDHLPVMEVGSSRTDFGYCADSSSTPYLVGEAPIDEETPPAPVEPEPAAASFAVSIDVYDAWSTGYCSKFTVTNDGTVAATPPSFGLVLPESVTISVSWNGSYSRSGELMEVTLPSYVGEMQPGTSRTDFGFCADGTTQPVLQSDAAEPTPEPEPEVAIFSGSPDMYNVWSTGYCVRLKVGNEGSIAAKPSNMQFSLPESVSFTTTWGGTLSRSGGVVSVALPSWLEDVQPGESILSGVGYCANGTTPPSNFIVE